MMKTMMNSHNQNEILSKYMANGDDSDDNSHSCDEISSNHMYMYMTDDNEYDENSHN